MIDSHDAGHHTAEECEAMVNTLSIQQQKSTNSGSSKPSETQKYENDSNSHEAVTQKRHDEPIDFLLNPDEDALLGQRE